MDELQDYLRTIEPGRIGELGDVERLLAGAWHNLVSDDGGMAGCKLAGRMERAEWHPPVLAFTIERHGGTALGSTRAELQRWSVDLIRRTATCERAGHRQLSPTARRVDVGPIAAEVAGLIVGCVPDARLRWLGDGRVRVEMARIFPERSAYKQTVQGRRKRLREALIEAIGPKGWGHLGRNTFGQAAQA